MVVWIYVEGNERKIKELRKLLGLKWELSAIAKVRNSYGPLELMHIIGVIVRHK